MKYVVGIEEGRNEPIKEFDNEKRRE